MPSVTSPAADAARPAGGWMALDEAIMGTAIRVELWSGEPAAGEAAMAAVMAEMHRIDRVMSPHKDDSELSCINREAARHAVELSEEMTGLLQRALDFSRFSKGAFDITYAAAGHLYDYRLGVRPSPEALARACTAIGWHYLELDSARRTLRFSRPGMRIDLGGFAKGYAVERGAAILRAHGIEHGIVTAGGDSRIVGDRRGRPWMIGVRDPRSSGVVAVLPLQDCAVSTSGDYERYFDADGERCHHLLDPRTGLSPTAVHGVTVVAADGLASEALSKTVFIHGVERGLRLVEAWPQADAVVIDAAGRLHWSAGFAQAETAGDEPARQFGDEAAADGDARGAPRGQATMTSNSPGNTPGFQLISPAALAPVSAREPVGAFL